MTLYSDATKSCLNVFPLPLRKVEGALTSSEEVWFSIDEVLESIKNSLELLGRIATETKSMNISNSKSSKMLHFQSILLK